MSADVNIGAVVIGRNEGERLERCLRSLRDRAGPVVYVDSGSTDGSVALARRLGANVVELDLTTKFTAGRARNEGVSRLRAIAAVDFVQLVDGDCELAEGWLGRAKAALDGNERVAVVCGRRRERHPERSPYNRLCDMEWARPAGEADACGGDALIRIRAFQDVGGFDPDLIAGEEPELCFRLREAGWTIQRIDAEMTLHDAAMTRFSQWWRRNVRAGHAHAENASLHGNAPERFRVRETRSNLFWGLGLPLTIASTWPAPWTPLLLVSYPIQAARISRAKRRSGASREDANLYGAFCVLGKIPQALGAARFHLTKLTGEPSQLIEYK